MIKIFSDQAWDDYQDWLVKDKNGFKKINKLIKDIDINGNDGIGHPEPLKHDLSGLWSRHINEKDRLIYRIVNDSIEIVDCKSHYGDK